MAYKRKYKDPKKRKSISIPEPMDSWIRRNSIHHFKNDSDFIGHLLSLGINEYKASLLEQDND